MSTTILFQLEFPDQFSDTNKKDSQYLMLFINPSLKAESGACYEIAYSLKASNVLSDVIGSNGEDFYVYKCKSELETLKLLFYVPKDLQIVLSNIDPGGRDRLERKFSLGPLVWIDGTSIDSAEVVKYDPPPGMKLIGWRASDLEPGHTVGVRAKV